MPESSLNFSRPADLEHGDRFGKLTVTKLVKTKGGLKYRVLCGCKRELYLRKHALTEGRKTSCSRCAE